MAIYEERIARDMARINEDVLRLGEGAQDSFHAAIECLGSRDFKLANETILREHITVERARQIVTDCHAFMAVHMPSAGHLRRVAMVTPVADEFKLINNHAATICREALRLSAPPSEAVQSKLDALIDIAKNVLRQSIAAFNTRDVGVALATITAADAAPEIHDEAVELLIATPASSSEDNRNMLAWFSVLNVLERICLRSQAICEETLYIETGELAVEESRYYVLLLDAGDGNCGKLAEAIGRKQYRREIRFMSASPNPAENIDPNIAELGAEKGLKFKGSPKTIEALALKRAAFDVVISLNGDVRSQLPKQPYHTIFLNWNVECDCGGGDLSTSYRTLRAHIDQFAGILLHGEAET